MITVRYNRQYKKVEINELNPNFTHLTGLDIPHIWVKAIFKNEQRTWEEEIKVSSTENAEKECREIIKFWNDTLKPDDLPREFVSLVI